MKRTLAQVCAVDGSLLTNTQIPLHVISEALSVRITSRQRFTSIKLWHCRTDRIYSDYQSSFVLFSLLLLQAAGVR